MTHEEAKRIATRMIASGIVAGVTDGSCQPTNERVDQLASMIMRGEVAAEYYTEYR